MAASWTSRALIAIVLIALAAGIVYALRPAPVPVDVATIGRGELVITVDEQAKTRIRDLFVVSAPVAGRMLRSPMRAGDPVEAGKTVVAAIRPAAPGFLDVRARRELEAAAAAADASVRLAEAGVARAQSELEFARKELARAQSLSRTAVISERSLEQASLNVLTGEAELASARATLVLRREEANSARARLIGPEQAAPDPADCCVEVRAPVGGRVLRVIAESEQVVTPGAGLLEIGDPRNLEIVAELLSSDAVRLPPEAPATVEGAGLTEPLHAKVRTVEPSGFTKVSALGIEEQRVNVLLDFTDPPEQWAALGHDYRVYVRIEVWRGDQVLRLPLGALFRSGGEWAVFKAQDGQATLTPVAVGHRNNEFAEIAGGLTAGDSVILYPSDRIEDGARIAPRE